MLLKTGGRLVDLVVQTRTDSVICACCDLEKANGGTEVADSRWSRAEAVIVPLIYVAVARFGSA